MCWTSARIPALSTPPANEPSATERVHGLLRARLIRGEMRPGAMVSLRTLAGEFGTSAMPVREAAGRLVSEGALEFVRNRGIRVPRMTRERLLDLTALRVFAETELVKRAAFLLPDEALQAARRADAAVNAAIAAGDAGAYMRANHAFHFGLYAAAASPVFFRLAESVWTQTGPVMSVVHASLSRLDYSDHHPRILEALARQDPAGAAEATRADIESGLDLIARAGFLTAPAGAAIDFAAA
ncbi:MAG: GntR family transcriptional regulator [Rhodobacteraceae bacterium]|nr:GntR family transcriptional regulator [Paracoccaceae bacterium]